MEYELRHYWQINHRGTSLLRTDPLNPEIDELRDEMEVLADMTDWPLLRTTALRCLGLDDAIRTRVA